MAIDRFNPDGMYSPPHDLYSQVVSATGTRQIHIAGTVARNEAGEVVGDDVAAQTRLTLDNVETSLAAAGASPADVVRITIYAIDCDDFLDEGYPEVVSFFSDDLPASALVGVDHLAHEDYLLELEVTALVEE